MCRRLRRAALRATVALALVCAAARAVAAHEARDRHGAPTHRCGFDELQARANESLVTGLSRVVAPHGARVVVPTDAAWQPIRIAVFTVDMSDTSRYCTKAGQQRPDFEGGALTCTDRDVLTPAKRRTLLELLIPSAIQLHQERLLVQPQGGNIVVDSASIQRHSMCREFHIPAAHMTTGVPNADFILYMAAGPTSLRAMAWALMCQRFDDGRPSVGVANVSPKYLNAEPQTVRTIAHELLHALGFSGTYFEMLDMSAKISIRGKRRVPVIISPGVVAQAQTHYGCPTQAFMELEDMGGSGSASSHWKRRSAKDDIMSGENGANYYTALTIAAMEDTGYYKGNYTLAEPMVYGRNAGCGLTSHRCVVNGVSQFPAMFCDSVETNMVCTSDRRGMGRCGIVEHPSLPSVFQYFASPTKGGADSFMDYCPYVQPYLNTQCIADKGVLFGSVFGVMSRCFDTTNGVAVAGRPIKQHGLCADVQCDAATKTYRVHVAGASGYTPCPSGASLSLNSVSGKLSSGRMTCPAYDAVCGEEIDGDKYKTYHDMLAPSAARGVPACVTAAVALVMLVLAVG